MRVNLETVLYHTGRAEMSLEAVIAHLAEADKRTDPGGMPAFEISNCIGIAEQLKSALESAIQTTKDEPRY